jgi:holo-[acyl-carrier protein] synthase
MRILGHGIDITPISRITRLLAEHPERFVERVYTAREQAYAGGKKRRDEHLAARFAAKEAVLKALGTGWGGGIAWTDVEVVSLPSGAPTIELHRLAAQHAARAGITSWLVSLTHAGDSAAASVIAVGE